jgi:endonuclease YncB( thermonuclease family)
LINSYQCNVVKVYDGDTIKCKTSDNKVHNIRLANIDAPELRQFYGKTSRDNLRALILTKDVNVDVLTTDYYKREVGLVTYSGIDVNKFMVTTGNAYVYKKFLFDNSYLELDDIAKRNKIGIHYFSDQQLPSDYRKNK